MEFKIPNYIKNYVLQDDTQVYHSPSSTLNCTLSKRNVKCVKSCNESSSKTHKRISPEQDMELQNQLTELDLLLFVGVGVSENFHRCVLCKEEEVIRNEHFKQCIDDLNRIQKIRFIYHDHDHF